MNNKYDWICDYSEGFAAVMLNKKWGFINKEGKEIFPLKYDLVSYFENGFARVKLNGKWGFIDLQGKEICQLKYDDALDFENGFAKVFLDEELYIDGNGIEYDKIKIEKYVRRNYD